MNGVGRRKIDSITIGFSTTDKLISKIIRWITGSKISHAWIGYYDETLGQRMVLQAEAWGYETRPWTRWIKQNKWVAEFIVPGRDKAKLALQNIATFLGVKYDYGAAFLLGFRRWFGRWIKLPYRNPGKLMCTEAVVKFLKIGGYPVADDLDLELTEPDVLWNKVLGDKEFIKMLPPKV